MASWTILCWQLLFAMMAAMKQTGKTDQLETVRHSLAHLLAAAVMALWPDTKRTIGPAIDNGFYFDFEFKKPISDEDLPKIEAKMRELLPTWDSFSRHELTAAEAKKEYPDNRYKHELIDEFSKGGEKVTFYKSGDYWDLCRGGHVEHMSEIDPDSFKLDKLAGAYWRGDEKNPMLTRIYGLAFATPQELTDYLKQQEEAKQRDHRVLGERLELFATSPEIGPGLILWLPSGTVLKEQVEQLGRETEKSYGYQRVSTPHIAKEELFHTSGHLPYYQDDMYPPMKMDNETYYLKPMNCPHMHMIYKTRHRSYRELPLRLAEFGTVYRNEDSGTLMGMLRVRGMTQNDAHIYCTEEQVVDELVAVMEMHRYYYTLFGIEDYYVELALPDLKGKKAKYFDDPKGWERAVALLRQAAELSKMEVVEKEGEAAFYGPKFDFNIHSVTGREFGASTNQLDFGSGQRFGLTYNDKDGKEKVIPYIIHRAPLGSMERFVGFLIEHYGGAFPVWLAPEQIRLATVNNEEKTMSFAQRLVEQALEKNLRIHVDDTNESIGKKIRNSELMKVPYTLVIGQKEIESSEVLPRVRKDLESVDKHEPLKVEDFFDSVANEAKSRASKSSL